MWPLPPSEAVTVAMVERLLSAERFGAYRRDAGGDDLDGLAHYLWNLALASALQPILHVLEVAFRNEISRAAQKLTAGRTFSFDRIPSWLDATRPRMLLDNEQKKVERAKEQLGTSPSCQTEGHLIAKLDFGFWVALCREPYSDSRGDGPRLWPRALDIAFRPRPADVTTRSQIHHRFDPIRKYRNRVAHHEPIWDRQYLDQHEYILESLAWMSPKMARVLRSMSTAPQVFRAGREPFKPLAHAILNGPPAGAGTIVQKLAGLSDDRRTLVESLVDSLTTAPDEAPTELAVAWAEGLRKS